MTAKRKPDDIGEKIAALALTIADGALAEGVPLETRLDSFKALTTYFVNTTKVNAKKPPGDREGAPTFDDIRKHIAATADRAGPGNPGDDAGE
jgi:hypothetical protein